MASLLLALHPAAFFSPVGRVSAAARVSAPTMVDADVQAQIEQLQAKLELMRLKAQLEELQRQAAAPPAPVVPDVIASAPPTLAQAEPIASAAAAVAQARPPAPPMTSAWSTFFPIPTEAESAAIDPLQDALRQQAAAAETASSAASAAAAAAAKGWTGNAAEAAASATAAATASATAKGWTVPPASYVPPPVAEATASYAATVAASGPPNMLPIGIVLSLPIGFLVGKSLISFINERYDEIKGGEDQAMPGYGVSPAKRAAEAALAAVGWQDAAGDSKASLQGTMFASDGVAARGGGGGGGVAPPPLRFSEEQEALEVARASSWYADQSPDGRNAQDIFYSGLQNLMDDQDGFWFGPPSPLYSNLPKEIPETSSMPETPRAAAAMAAAAAVAAPPPMAAASAAMAAPPPQAAPPASFAMPATPATPAPTPAPTNAESELAGFMSKAAPPASKLRRSKRKASGAAPSAARVPPSSPEQVEAARRGEYDYTGGRE